MLVGFRGQWHFGLTTGYVLALLLLPLTFSALALYRWAKTIVGALVVCLAYGLLVTTWTADSHVISSQARTQAISLHIGIVVSVLLVLWARTLMPPGLIAVLIGAGGCVSLGIPTESLAETWKFSYALPLTLVVLGLASMTGSWKAEIVALFALGSVTLSADARSLFATYLMASGILLWSAFRKARTQRSARASGMALVILALFLVYQVADYLVLQGFLGEKAQQRSLEDAARTGSTLLGGRPELAATYSLMTDHFAGYGLGALPTTHDVAVGNAALIRMGLRPTQDGFSEYMFGRQQFELHSIFGDLWANFGAAGLVTAGLLTVLVLWVLASAVIGYRMSALVLFLACYTGWNVVSSPLWSAEGALIVFLGLALPLSVGGRATYRERSGSLDDIDGIARRQSIRSAPARRQRERAGDA